MKSLSRVRLFAPPWTVAHQAPPSMEFSRQEYWGGLPFPSPGNLPGPGIEPGSPALWADALVSLPPGSPIQSEVSQKEKNKYCILMTYMESRGNGTNEHICRTEIETQTERTDLWTQRAKERVGQMESSTGAYT